MRGSPTPVFAPFTFQLGAFSPAANMDDGTSPEDLAFLERASASELSRSLGGADGRIGFAIKANGPRWMSSLALTTRTVNDAEVFDVQAAAVARAGFLVATSSDYNLHLGASGTYVFSPADQGQGTSPRHPLRFRERPEIRVDSVRLIDTGSIDADNASVYGLEFGGNWKSLYLQGEHFWYDVARRGSASLPDPDFTGYYLQGSWMLTGESRRYNAATGSFQNPRPLVPFSGNGGWGAWELAMRYSRMNLNFNAGLEGTAATPDSCARWRSAGLDARRELVSEPEHEGDVELPADRRGPIEPCRAGKHAALRPRTQHAADRRAGGPGSRRIRVAHAVQFLVTRTARKWATVPLSIHSATPPRAPARSSGH
jgi:phosphate-selective porin